MRHFLVYAVIRLGLWAVIWWLLTLFDVGVMLAGVLAALIAMLISILFLNRLRDRAAMRWKDAHDRRVERRGEPVDEDADYEDSLLDDDEAGEATDEADRDDEAAHGAARPAELPEMSTGHEHAVEKDVAAETETAETAEAGDSKAGDSKVGAAETRQGPVRGSDR